MKNEQKLGGSGVTDAVSSKEMLPMPISNRVVVFGTRVAGVYDLAEAFQEYLEQRGIINPQVEAYRDVANIVEGFYGTLQSPNEIKAEKPKPEPSLPRGVIAFPYMRLYGHAGQTVGIKVEAIQALCAKHGVPFVYLAEAYIRTVKGSSDYTFFT